MPGHAACRDGAGFDELADLPFGDLEDLRRRLHVNLHNTTLSLTEELCLVNSKELFIGALIADTAAKGKDHDASLGTFDSLRGENRISHSHG